MISGAAQADVCLLMVPADGNFTTAIQKGDHKVRTQGKDTRQGANALANCIHSTNCATQLAYTSILEHLLIELFVCDPLSLQAGEIQGQTRQHARLINLLGVKQLIVGVNKMDSDTAGYKKERYDEIANEMRHMLVRVGWKDDFVNKSVPILPISGWLGDNLITKVRVAAVRPVTGAGGGSSGVWSTAGLKYAFRGGCCELLIFAAAAVRNPTALLTSALLSPPPVPLQSTNMTWYSGQEVVNLKGEKIQVHTLLDALNSFVVVPERKTDAPLRLPISGAYKIKGVGDVLAGRVEQGVVKPGDEVIFLPTHTTANPCTGKVFTVEMHHKRVDKAGPGDNVGMNIKGLDKGNMPRTGDVMILKSDQTLKIVKDFTAQIQTLDIPGEVKKGYSPIGFVRCGRSACRISGINWKVGKETGGKKMENPVGLKANEMAEVVYEPTQPLIVDSFKNCEGLSRIAFLDGNTAVMLGKVVSVTHK